VPWAPHGAAVTQVNGRLTCSVKALHQFSQTSRQGGREQQAVCRCQHIGSLRAPPCTPVGQEVAGHKSGTLRQVLTRHLRTPRRWKFYSTPASAAAKCCLTEQKQGVTSCCRCWQQRCHGVEGVVCYGTSPARQCVFLAALQSLPPMALFSLVGRGSCLLCPGTCVPH
jgi:hypothetical protein